MNKEKGIIIGVLALLVTMMVGYAIFSETITINGTATAKGEFAVGVTCQAGLNESLTTVDEIMEGFGSESGYKNDACSVSGNTVTYNVELEYPGAKRFFTAKITNKGNIDAILNFDENSITEENKVCSDTDGNGTISDSECEIGTDQNIGLFSQSGPDLIIGFEKSDGTLISVNRDSEDAYAEFIINDGSALLLNPGESVYFAYVAMMPLGYGKDDSDAKIFNLKSTSSITYKFIQPTAQ